ncbi:histidinol-phosphate transaminase [Propionicicella superfundia]|uniref:histidinol-phosphate transaminase n=1 Tax=Propionicicella superfundia TaxID=348582 RepID=UPI00042157C7|nr:histidinol-phosphate transaminase [Propionicicella superfundia]
MTGRRDVVASLPLYKQGAMPTSADVVKLSSNENPYPPLPSVVSALTGALGAINLYPDMGAVRLRSALAQRYGVAPGNIAVGAGSVEVAQQIVHAVAGPGDEVVFAWRSFEAYPIITLIAGATPVAVPLTAGDRHDLDAMAAAITPATKLVFVCTPNNPTGTAPSAAEVEAFLTRVPADVLVVIDEAYVHFNRRPDAVSGMDLFRAHDNVIVLHTFSKAYGLAGLRVGYAVAPEPIADDLRRVSVPFAVTDLAQTAALASLDADRELSARVDRIVAERDRVTAGLAASGWPVGESQANFVWLRAGDDTARVDAALRDAGVLVRAWDGEGLRITIGTPEADDRVLSVLAGIREVIG